MVIKFPLDTKNMSPDEYSHYVLRYSAIRSGLAEYNLTTPKKDYSEEIQLVLRSCMENVFDGLMDDLEDFPDDRRTNALNYFIEQIARFDATVWDLLKR